jgi:hypothetical protein
MMDDETGMRRHCDVDDPDVECLITQAQRSGNMSQKVGSMTLAWERDGLHPRDVATGE